MEERYIAAVDLGSSKVALSVAQVTGEDVQIIYFAQKPSDGIRHGCVFNPTRASEPVKQLIEDAQNQLGIKILQVVLGLPRYWMKQVNSSARIDRSDPASCISFEEVESLKNIALDGYPLDNPEKEEIYGAVIQSFSSEDLLQVSEEDVVGVQSSKVEGNFKIFIGDKKASANLDTMMNRAGVAIGRKYFLPDITANAILSEEEKMNGVALLEIGAGVSSVTIYQKGVLRYYGSIPFGGDSLTEDIKNECGFSHSLAENIKLAFGVCLPEKLQSLSEKIIQVNNDEDGSCLKLPVKYLSEIITCRIKEIAEALFYLIEKSGYADSLRNGLVLTGGCADLVNCGNLLKELSGYNVRVAYPRTKHFCSSLCPGIKEAGAASSMAMILKARGDKYLNCTEGTVKTAPAPDEDEIAGSVFDKEAFEKVEKKKKEKKPKTEVSWVKKMKEKVENQIFENYDEMR